MGYIKLHICFEICQSSSHIPTVSQSAQNIDIHTNFTPYNCIHQHSADSAQRHSPGGASTAVRWYNANNVRNSSTTHCYNSKLISHVGNSIAYEQHVSFILDDCNRILKTTHPITEKSCELFLAKNQQKTCSNFQKLCY